MGEDFTNWSRKRSTVANGQAEASVWLTSISIISNQPTIRSATTPMTPSSASSAIHCKNRRARATASPGSRSEEHTSELQSRFDLVCRLLLEKKKTKKTQKK